MTKVLIVGGFAPSLIGFRGPLLRAMRGAGHEVIACAAENDPAVAATLAAWSIAFTPLPLRRAGLNPFSDRAYLTALRELIGREQPAVIMAYTHKPVIYSALAVTGGANPPRVYALITGLGFAFIAGGGLKQRLAGGVLRFLYRRAARHFSGVMFQNPDDRDFFREGRLVRPETPQVIVRGSGIDLGEFSYSPLDSDWEQRASVSSGALAKEEGRKTEDVGQMADDVGQRTDSGGRFLLIARLLGDKGIREYASAAKEIRKTLPAAEFHLVGPFDPNPATISKEELESWQRDGVIIYHGAQDDVRPMLRACTVYVLPSYREGTPRTVLEAMATGRPIITTDAAGCRETIFDAGPPDAQGVRQGRNGFLVPVKSADGLVAAMRSLLADRALAGRMGRDGRRLVEEHYDVHAVNRQIMEFMGLSAERTSVDGFGGVD